MKLLITAAIAALIAASFSLIEARTNHTYCATGEVHHYTAPDGSINYVQVMAECKGAK